MTVSSGADVTTQSLKVGNGMSEFGAGTVLVTGTGSTWTNKGLLQVGLSTESALRVEEAATFLTGTVSPTSVFSNGAIELDGGIFNANDDMLVGGGGARLTKTVGSQFNLAAGKTLTVESGADVVFDGAYTIRLARTSRWKTRAPLSR